MQTLEFRVLGPLEVTRGGEPMRLGGERQRALIALLLVRPNQLVTTDALAEQLFGAAVTEGAVNAVHVAVSRLRRLLEADHPREIVTTRPGGYVLALTPGQLDLARFEQLSAAGRRRLADGDPAEGAECLRQALALWRGPALSDLATVDAVQPEIRRLESLRMMAVLDRVDADLALGRGAELIAELEALAAEDPLNERLRGQLMLALYRAGRQADALAVYREMSAVLRGQLGIGPSPALRELERSILHQHASLAPFRTPAKPAARSLFRTCPFKGHACFERSDADYFFGREQVIADVVAHIAESSLVGIIGPAAVGKSSILRAGILPALSDGVLPGSERWRQILVCPGPHPLAELARITDDDPHRLREAPGGDRVVAAVDQFEQLFASPVDPAEAVAFMDALAALAGDAEHRIIVLCAVRAQTVERVDVSPSFAAALRRCRVFVAPIDRLSLARVITEPAARAGLSIEGDLVDALIGETAHDAAGVALVSAALLELWRRGEGRTLRLSAFRATGNMRGMYARLAEELYMSFDANQRAVARRLIVALLHRREQPRAAGRMALGELIGPPGVAEILSALAAARIVAVGPDTVELLHPRLLREWPRAGAWLAEDRRPPGPNGPLTAVAG